MNIAIHRLAFLVLTADSHSPRKPIWQLPVRRKKKKIIEGQSLAVVSHIIHLPHHSPDKCFSTMIYSFFLSLRPFWYSTPVHLFLYLDMSSFFSSWFCWKMFILFYDTTVSCFRWRRGKGVESNLFYLFGQLVPSFHFSSFDYWHTWQGISKKESGTQRGDAKMEREKRDWLIVCLLCKWSFFLFVNIGVVLFYESCFFCSSCCPPFYVCLSVTLRMVHQAPYQFIMFYSPLIHFDTLILNT